jgi:HSP20 family molecular chaperone IbpA
MFQMTCARPVAVGNFDSLSRALDEMFGSGDAPGAGFAPFNRNGNSDVVLPVDVSDNGSEVVIRASLPGFKRDEVEITVHDGVLTIRAESVKETESACRPGSEGCTSGECSTDAAAAGSESKETVSVPAERFYRRERVSGSLMRRIQLPQIVAGSTGKAELKDGVLTLRFAHSEQAKPRHISVE